MQIERGWPVIRKTLYDQIPQSLSHNLHILSRLNEVTLKKNAFISKPGVVTIGFRNKSGNASAVLGRLSGFNIWSLLVTENEILRMSYGCGEVIGNAMDWGKVTNGLIGEVEVRSLPTCNDDKRKAYLDKHHYCYRCRPNVKKKILLWFLFW